MTQKFRDPNAPTGTYFELVQQHTREDATVKAQIEAAIDVQPVAGPAPARDVNGPNPKDLAGRSKPDLGLVSGTMIAHLAAALEDGAAKYGVANWRQIPVEARTYISAAMRHLLAWSDGEDWVPDSHGHHLGHALATIAIVLDAWACGTLIDNRATAGAAPATFLQLAQRRKLWAQGFRPMQGSTTNALLVEPAGPKLPPELAHPAARLATSAFAAEAAAKKCTSPGSCHAAQKCLGGPSCPRNADNFIDREPEKPTGFGPEDFGGSDYP